MPERSLPDLVSRLRIDTSGLKTAAVEAESFTGKLSAGLAVGFAAVAAAGVAVTAFALKAVDDTTAAGQAAYEMSEKFGLLPQQASAWLSVGKQLGLSNDDVSKGFQFLGKNVEAMNLSLHEHGKVTAGLLQPYKDLGLNVFDASGKIKSSNELMLEAADVFAKMPDGVEKTGLAMKIFGRSGADLIPVLDQGRAGIEAMMAQGQAMGDVMSGPQVEAAHKLYLEQKQLNVAMQGITTQVGVALMPVMQRLMDFVLSTAIPAIKRFAEYFQQHLWPAIQQIWAAFMELLSPALTYISDHFDQLKPVLIALAIAAGIALGAIVLALGLVVLAVTGLVVAITWFVGRLEYQFGVMKSTATAVFTAVGGFFAGLGTTARNVANTVSGAFTSVVTFVQGLPAKIAAAARGMWDGLWDEFKPVYDLIAEGLNRMISAFNALPHLGLPSLPALPIYDVGGLVPGLPGSHQVAVLEAGERVIPADEASKSGDMSKIEALLREISAKLDPPEGQIGVEAALYKAVQGAGLNRARGMAGG